MEHASDGGSEPPVSPVRRHGFLGPIDVPDELIKSLRNLAIAASLAAVGALGYAWVGGIIGTDPQAYANAVRAVCGH